MNAPGKKFLPLVLIIILITIGTLIIQWPLKYDPLLKSLPDLPALNFETKTLRIELECAVSKVRQIIYTGEKGRQLGKAFGQLGKIYQANDYFERARACYYQALKLDPDNPRWYYFSAVIIQMMGREDDDVTALLQKTVMLAPDYGPAYLRLADNYFKTEKLVKAMLNYKKCLESGTANAHAFLGLARIALKNNAWNDAQSYLKQAIKVAPAFGNLHRLMARIHDHFGRPAAARDALKYAQDCGPFFNAPDALAH